MIYCRPSDEILLFRILFTPLRGTEFLQLSVCSRCIISMHVISCFYQKVHPPFSLRSAFVRMGRTCHCFYLKIHINKLQELALWEIRVQGQVMVLLHYSFSWVISPSLSLIKNSRFIHTSINIIFKFQSISFLNIIWEGQSAKNSLPFVNCNHCYFLFRIGKKIICRRCPNQKDHIYMRVYKRHHNEELTDPNKQSTLDQGCAISKRLKLSRTRRKE